MKYLRGCSRKDLLSPSLCGKTLRENPKNDRRPPCGGCLSPPLVVAVFFSFPTTRSEHFGESLDLPLSPPLSLSLPLPTPLFLLNSSPRGRSRPQSTLAHRSKRSSREHKKQERAAAPVSIIAAVSMAGGKSSGGGSRKVRASLFLSSTLLRRGAEDIVVALSMERLNG